MRSDLKKVQKDGLVIESPNGDFCIEEVQAFASSEEIGPVDLVIIALKTTSNGALIDLIDPLLKANTRILTLQNGLGNESLLHQLFPSHPIFGGMCFVCINRGNPGVIRHLAHGRVELGELTTSGQLADIADLFRNAGIDCRELPDLGLARWRKLVWNVPFNGLSIAAGSLDTCQILESPKLVKRVRALMREVIATAASQGHHINPEYVEANIKSTREMGPYEPSSLIDFKAGNPVEIEAIWGKPLSSSREAGIPTPELEKLYFEICDAIEKR